MTRNPVTSDVPAVAEVASEPPALTGSEYEIAHWERLANTLDLDTWRAGADLVHMYERLASEIELAVRQETIMQQRIRNEIFPYLKTRPGAPRVKANGPSSSPMSVSRIVNVMMSPDVAAEYRAG